MKTDTDVVIAGGGIVGLATAAGLFRQRVGAQLALCAVAVRGAREAGDTERRRRLAPLLRGFAAQAVQLGPLHQQALHEPVERALLLGCTDLTLLLDSDLLVNQLRGTYKVKAPHLRPLRQQAIDLLARLQRWDVRYVPRKDNKAADRLANLALDGRQP